MRPTRHPRRAGLMATGAAALLALAACSETVGEAALGVAAGHDVEIEEDGASVSYRTADGEVTITGGEAAALPGNFPGDVFVPEAYVVESTLAMNDDLFVALAVHQDVPALYAAARAGMAGHGWTETMAALENDGNGLLTFEKDDRSAVLSMARADAGATLGLQLTRMAP